MKHIKNNWSNLAQEENLAIGQTFMGYPNAKPGDERLVRAGGSVRLRYVFSCFSSVFIFSLEN